MTIQMWITMAVLVFVILLFVFEWVRVDVVGIIMMVLLPILGLISPQDAFIGLSSNAVVSIMAVIIIGAGLDKTGVMNKVANPIIKLAGNSEKKIMALVSGTVGIISSMMQNIGAAALFLPATQRISKRVGIPVSRLLMPMGFCAIIGGTITLVGASPTILLNDLLVLDGVTLEPFGLFTQTPIGICLLASAIIYFMILGKVILPSRGGTEDKGATLTLLEQYKGLDQTFEAHIPDSFEGPKELGEMAIRPTYLVTVVAIATEGGKEKNFVPRSSDTISPGDDIVIVGNRENAERFASDLGFSLKDGLEEFAESFARTNSGMLEAIVAPRSELIGKSMSQLSFKKHFMVNPLAVFRGEKIFYGGITNLKLRMGDAILMQGPWERFHFIKQGSSLGKPELVFASPLEGEVLRPEKAKLAVLWLAIGLALVMFSGMRLSICLMAGALGMIVTKVLTVDEAYTSVDWMTVFLLAGLIPLGMAFEQTGTAAFIANAIMAFIGEVPYIVLLLVIGVLTSCFTLVVSNVGATVLLVPLCMNMAVMAGGDPRMAALVVGISASNTFVLPTHQVNALVMRPGGYRTVDYAKAGAVMTLIFLVVMISMIYFFYI